MKGAIGFGEYKVKLLINHKYSLRLYKLCEEYGIPILLHIDNQHNYGIESVFIDIVSKYSVTVFMMHGPGWWRHISSKPGCEAYPRGMVKPGGLIERIIDKFDNVYADISTTSG
ncbi:MAG: hypothetical protein QW695_03875 [Candidatus Bathyarchaeia archaeon]